MEHYDILIIGAGAAGIAAAKECQGLKVLLSDRRPTPGGILLQCAHRGFGSGKSGPEYAAELLRDLPPDITPAYNTTVLSLSREKTALLSGRDFGRREIRFSQLILAAGCREIPLGALPIAGTRPEGVYTAGQMQELMNLRGFRPEGPAVILGSGDLGLIMANHLAEAGVTVTLVEQKSSCGGMARNRRCLAAHPIRLICNDTVTEVHGYPRITGCTTAAGLHLPCTTLLIAAGLRPERELVSHLDDPPWLHICGNCSTVHPMVEAVVQEGKMAGIAAAEQVRFIYARQNGPQYHISAPLRDR